MDITNRGDPKIEKNSHYTIINNIFCSYFHNPFKKFTIEIKENIKFSPIPPLLHSIEMKGGYKK